MFMLWLGLAAILVGVDLAAPSIWSWQAQLLAFAVFAIASVPAWRHFARKVEKPADSPFLNRRADGYVGRVFTLEKPIVDGVGTVRIDDTVWRVQRAGLPGRQPGADRARRRRDPDGGGDVMPGSASQGSGKTILMTH